MGITLPEDLDLDSSADRCVTAYVNAGLRPILIHVPTDGKCSCGIDSCPAGSHGKHPISAKWQKPQTVEELRAQIARLKFRPNIGIVLGDQPGGEYLVAVDVDDDERFAALVQEYGPLPETVRGESGRGYRLLFELPAGVPRADVKNVTGLGGDKGVDVKVKGGQVVVAPSLHKNGKRYTWTRFGAIAALPLAWAIHLIPVAPPEWIRDYTPSTFAADAKAQKRSERYVEAAVLRQAALLAGIGEGARNATLNASALRLFGLCNGSYLGPVWEDFVERELARAAKASGLTDKEIRATLASARRAAVRKNVLIAIPDKPKKNGANGHANGKSNGVVNPAQLFQAAPDDAGRTHDRTDLRNAEKLVAWHGPALRHVPIWKKWLTWDASRWKIDELGQVYHLAKQTSRRILALAIERQKQLYDEYATIDPASEPERFDALKRAKRDASDDVDHGITSQSAARLAAMVAIAGSDPSVVVSADRLDKDPWALNAANGTIDLRTGAIRPARQADMITKLAPVAYDPAAACPTWIRFLERVLPNETMRDFVHRAIGYALTGDVREQVLFFFYGQTGNNGKSTFLATLHALLGDYAAPAPRALLFKGRREQHPTELATLFGKRFVTCSETDEGQAFDEGLVKDLTGGDPITCRRMQEDFWSYLPTHKLFLAGNHKPTVRGDDGGIWRRMRLVPWTVTIPDGEIDKTLVDRLRAELPGVLAWAVRGCLEWQRRGLAVPQDVSTATKAYRDENDILGQFFRMRVVFEPGAVVARYLLRTSYEQFCKELGAEPFGAKRFSARLRENSVSDTTVREGAGVFNAWRGVRLKRDNEIEA